MNATIDREGCISCGICAELCPDVFAMAGDGRAEVIAQPSRGSIHDAHEAEESCPVQVITVEE